MMHKSEIFRKTAGLLLVTALTGQLFTGCGSASSEASSSESSVEESTEKEDGSVTVSSDKAVCADKKSEIVTAKADASGNITEISDEVTLSGLTEGSNVLEKTNLTDIKNTDGDEEFSKTGDGELVFENHGEDITYKGSSEDELPVTVKVTYYLDGVEKTPEEMAGASGDVTIRLDYESQETCTVTEDGKTYETPVPFAVLSAAMLDEDVFSDVEVTGGELISLGGTQAAVGIAFPGLGDFLDLTSYEAFEDSDDIPDSVEIKAHAENFALSFTETFVSNGITGSLKEDTLNDLDDLTDAMNDLAEASGDILEGIGSLYDGADQFSEYLTQYTDGVSALDSGVKQLAEGVSQLNDNKTKLAEGASGLAEGLAGLNTALSGSAGSLNADTLTAAVTAIAADLSTVTACLSSLDSTLSAAQSYVTKAETWQNTVRTCAQQADSSLAAINTDNLSSEDKTRLTDARNQLSTILSLTVPEKPSLSVDTSSLEAAISDLNKQFQIMSAAGSALSGLGTTLANLKSLVSQLAQGSSGLKDGITAFNSGIDTLCTGIQTLASGSSQLSSAGSQLGEAAQTLVSGISELKEGYQKFDEEGIRKLTDAAEDQIRPLLTKLKALREADKTYDNYSGKYDGQDCSVSFMIETGEIK